MNDRDKCEELKNENKKMKPNIFILSKTPLLQSFYKKKENI